MILTMIVKNESACIYDAIKSAAPYCGHYAIVDTGSTDNTIDTIYETVKQFKMRGIFDAVSWRGFADARNVALKTANDVAFHYGLVGRDAYALMLDADDMIASPIILPDNADHAAYKTQIMLNNVSYERVNIFRLGIGWRYRGVIHEFPELQVNVGGVTMTGEPHIGPNSVGTIKAGVHGARSRDPLKYLHDADTINKAMMSESDPFMSSRYCFYLAQSYRDALHSGAAIYWYQRRLDVAFWSEERYISCLNLGRLTGDANWFARATAINPERAEAWRALGQDKMADRCTPQSEWLFVELDKYGEDK